jgi:ABC-type lipoprotein release transport system permease subunit
MIGTRFDRLRVLAVGEKSMLYSIVTPVVVFLLALGASYLITRPIGDARRYISATLICVGLGIAGGLATATIAISVCASLAAAVLGMMLASRRRTPVAAPQKSERNQTAKRSHYHTAKHA